LNYADIFLVLGLYSATPEGKLIPGFEFSGVVESVGDDISEDWLGKRVYGISRFGSYATYINVPITYVKKTPNDWTDQQACAYPAQTLTVYYALEELGRLKPNHNVLVHSAAGGCGLAALSILSKKSAKVVGTVGTSSKLDLLNQKYGENPNFTFILREPAKDFENRARQALLKIDEEDSFDIVLDSVMGDWFWPNYELLKSEGKLIVYGSASFTPTGNLHPIWNIIHWIKLGWKYIWRPTIDPMQIVKDNKTISGFNLIHLYEKQERMNQLFEQLQALELEPPSKINEFEFDQAVEALTHFKSGKTVVGCACVGPFKKPQFSSTTASHCTHSLPQATLCKYHSFSTKFSLLFKNMDSVKVSKVNTNGAKDNTQNEVNREEASASHVDSTAPPNAASPNTLPTLPQVTDNSLHIQKAEAQPQQLSVTGSNKDNSIPPSTTSIVPSQPSASVTPSWPSNPSSDVKPTMSNSTISDSTPKQALSTPQNETTTDSKELVNFPSSTSIDSSQLGSFNQFPVNPEQTTLGQPNSPSPAKAKPFVCPTCNQTFSRQHNLKSHALTHSQEKPFQCNVCQHFFRRQHDLKRHMKLHTGEKPYQCTYCKRSFARLDALNRHLRAESFCGGPQKKIYQGSDSKSAEQVQQQPPVQLSPQQTTPQPQLLSTTQPQSKTALQSDPKSNSTNKQVSNPSTNSHSKIDLSRQTQDYYKRQQMMNQEYHSWPHQLKNQQPSSNQPNAIQAKSMPSNIIIPNNAHHQIIFPVETPTSIPTNGATPHYQLQYAHSPEFNVQISETRRAPESLVPNEQQDIDGRIIHPKSSSQRDMQQLLERNKYLEDRVRELENEVINERKLRDRREYLEQRVTELEIEKNLLKSLLLERNGTPETNHIHEKKRKATSPIEPPNPSKHQKDGDRIIIPQSSQ
ncbi:4081_t:CDS:2, partial [Gigaspora rosea]